MTPVDVINRLIAMGLSPDASILKDLDRLDDEIRRLRGRIARLESDLNDEQQRHGRTRADLAALREKQDEPPTFQHQVRFKESNPQRR